MADAHGSGPCDSNIMRVQVPFPASKLSLYLYKENGRFLLTLLFQNDNILLAVLGESLKK